MDGKRIVRCANGHMFNSEKHGNKCPHCDSSLGGATMMQKQPSAIDDPDATVGISENDGIEPVVGWLVCIEGVQRGQDYRIRQGINYIGRSDAMHICIIGDDTISRNRHASIVYDARQRKFLLLPGEGGGLVYVSNQVRKEEAVLAATEIDAYDVIEIGRSKFIFINLCGIHFDWINKEE